MPASYCEPITKASKYHSHLDDQVHLEFSLADCDLDAAVLSTPIGCVVARDRIGRTEPVRGDAVASDALRNQEVGDRLGPVPAQRNIDRVIAGVVGITIDRDARPWAGLQLVCHLSQHLLRTRRQREPVGVEVDRRP